MVILDVEKEVSILLGVGAVALANIPYNQNLCNKWGITKEQFNYLKLHYKHNSKQALNDLIHKCVIKKKGE